MRTNVSPKDWEFSLFFNTKKGLNNTTPLGYIDLKRLIEIYKSNYLKKQSKELVNAKTEEEKKRIKSLLPYITPTGSYSYRNNQSILSYNSSLLPLDIDELSKEDAIECQYILASQRGCVLSIISPRGGGVKALFYLGNEIVQANHYTTLTENRDSIATFLDITQYREHIDIAQNKLSQPFFIGYNRNSFFNENPLPTRWKIVNTEKKIIEHIPPTYTNRITTSSIESKRIGAYFEKQLERDAQIFALIPKGQRHSNIWKVGGMSSIIHYAPELGESMKGEYRTLIKNLYVDEFEFQTTRAEKTFNDSWEYGLNNPKKNDIIEQIIVESIVESKKEEQ
jgi:hypothetical protein